MINIFNKDVMNLTYEDIVKLVDEEVSEGWTLEYKQEFKKPKEIAKSISSFANSDGGYYIIGIKESDDDKNEAKQIIGLSKKHYFKPYERIANAIKDHISPTPYFETKVIDIPNTNKYIVVVFVPEGVNPPYLHHGSIYQRVGEVTNPKTIYDRYTLDYLINKSDKNNKIMLNFFENDINIMNKKNNPKLELYFYNRKNYQTINNFFNNDILETLKNIFDSKINVLPETDEDNIPASFGINISQAYKSYIIKNNADMMDIFCEIFHTGNCKIIMDIPCISFNYLSQIEYRLISYQLNRRNFDLTQLENFKFINIESLHLILAILINKYFKFIESLENYSYDFVFKFKLLNCEESTLKFNLTKDYQEYYQRFGIPICYKKYVESDIVSINETLLDTKGDKSLYPMAIYIDILMALGLITNSSKRLIADQTTKIFSSNKK